MLFSKSSPRITGYWQTGFSLMEMAIVLMILGILMGGVLVSVSQTTANARRAEALGQLRQIEEALYGFAEANGRLPCPASPDGTGLEGPVGGGACTIIHGFVPAATLGLTGSINSDGLLLDSWQNPYRYSVASTSTPKFTLYSDGTNSSIKFYFASNTGTVANTNMMRVCSTVACGANEILSDIAPAVVFTMGEDWANTTSAKELANANTTGSLTGTVSGKVYYLNDDFDFVSSDYSEDQYDDQLVWLSPYVLFNRMVSAGKLP